MSTRGIIMLIILLLGMNAYAEEVPFRVGERLIYNVYIFGIRAGVQEVCVKERVKVGKDDVYHIVSETRTTPFFSRFYRVHDTLNTYIGVKDLLPRYFEKHIYEGGYINHTVVEFDQVNLIGTATVKILSEGKEEHSSIKLIPNTLDTLSLIYYLRARQLIPGESLNLSLLTGTEPFLIKVNLEKRENLSTPLGKFTTIKAKQRGGGIAVWFTDDESHIPVKIEVDISIGRLRAILCKVEGIE